MNQKLRQALYERAQYTCECGCRRSFGGMLEAQRTVDHFFGVKNAPETKENLWVLRWDCHVRKTTNFPNSKVWLLKFIKHCGEHAYLDAALKAQEKLEWLYAKGVVA